MPRRGETAVVPIDADGAGRGRPKSAHGPGHHGHQHRSGNRPRPPQQEFRPFRRWFPFLVPLFVVANVGLFALTMYVNDCPAHAAAADAAIGGAAQAQGCLLQPQLGRFAFQAYRENPLIGPSSATFALCIIIPVFPLGRNLIRPFIPILLILTVARPLITFQRGKLLATI